MIGKTVSDWHRFIVGNKSVDNSANPHFLINLSFYLSEINVNQFLDTLFRHTCNVRYFCKKYGI